MASLDLFLQWAGDGIVRNDGTEDYELWSGELFIFDTVLRTVSTTTVRQNVYFTPVQDTPPADYSRDPADLAAQALGDKHQYPDGLVLYLGTMFAPVKDRGGAGKGFTHKLGDVVTISTSSLGTLSNSVNLSTHCPPWTYGASHLLRDLARADLL